MGDWSYCCGRLKMPPAQADWHREAAHFLRRDAAPFLLLQGAKYKKIPKNQICSVGLYEYHTHHANVKLLYEYLNKDYFISRGLFKGYIQPYLLNVSDK